jgi:hypothetical protein
MANISISDLYSSDAESFLTSIDVREGGLIKSAVNRALDARGGLSVPSSTLVRPYPFPIGIIYIPDYEKNILSL